MSQLTRRRLAVFAAERLLAGDQPAGLVKQLAAYLIDHRRQSEVELLVADIALALEELAGHGRATVTTARPMSAAARRAVIDLLKNELDIKTVELEERVDESVIGGVRIETADTTYDGTVRRKLQRLNNSI